MKPVTKILSTLFLCLLLIHTVNADSSFVVKDIRLKGLKQVSPGLVFRNFPINVGDRVGSNQLTKATRKLFDSGYFDDISLAREQDTLVINLKERPAISLIRISGNKILKKEALLDGLKQSGLQEGDIFKKATLDKIKQDLVSLYASQGRYGASVTAKVETLPENRVAINISIKEGKVATIQHINIVGNEVFTDEELEELFSLKLPNFWSFYTDDDRYARQKLSGDLERLRSHYMDNGYINFSIDSTQVSLSPDKKQVYITVNVTEGSKFVIQDVDISGKMVVDEQELKAVLTVKPEQIFSQKKVTESQEALMKKIGDAGYMFANISANPKIDKENHRVSVRFFIDPGKRVYVRRILIRGNTRTADEVIRQRLKQMEAAIASNELIEQSKERLEKASFFKSVSVETIPVPGSDDKVDVQYTVVEQQSGSLRASLGFSKNSGIILGLDLKQTNFLGTGKQIDMGISNSDTLTEYAFNYLDPYYTVNGVSRGFELHYRKRDFDENNASSFSTDEAGGGINFGYPIDDYQRLNFGLSIEQIKIKSNPEKVPAEISQFIDNEGDKYLDFIFRASWVDNHLNKGFFPTKGFSQSASLDLGIPGSDLSYYKLRYNAKWYKPLTESGSWIMAVKGKLGYASDLGSNDYPFFRNFYSGGLNSVRGYSQNSLGPRDTKNDPLGGNVMIAASTEFIFPTPFVKDQSAWRTLFFIDGGNVFSTKCSSVSLPERCSNGVHLDELRFSAGFGLSWLTPFGPLSLAVSAPLNDKKGDDTEVFQFALGQTF